MQKATLGAIAVIAVLSVVMSTLGALTASRTFTNSGSVNAVGIGVYSDSACTIPVSNINWGTISPAALATNTIYVENSGTVPVTLTMSSSSWNPANASSYITLSWNRENFTLAAGSSVQALLTLNVSSSVSGITSFTFNVTITGTQ